MKKLISLLLVVVMLVGIIPTAFAAAQKPTEFSSKATFNEGQKPEWSTFEIKLSWKGLVNNQTYTAKYSLVDANGNVVKYDGEDASGENTFGVTSGSVTVTENTDGYHVIKTTVEEKKLSAPIEDCALFVELYNGGEKIAEVKDLSNKVVVNRLYPKTNFVDVGEKAFYADAVKYAVAKKITNGTSAIEFSPDNSCTRGQIVTFLWRAAGSPEPSNTSSPFKDVKNGAYYYKAVLWAYENGITSGVDDTHFGPDNACTRGQIVTFLYRAEFGRSTIKFDDSDIAFKDVSPKAFCYNPVVWAVEKGITSGVSKTKFAPNDPCNRAQAVTFIYRYAMSKLAKMEEAARLSTTSDNFNAPIVGSTVFKISGGVLVLGAINGKPAYTIEPYQEVQSGEICVQGNEDPAWWDKLSDGQRSLIHKALALGYPTMDYPTAEGDSGTYDADLQKAAATQIIIYEILAGYRNTSYPYDCTNDSLIKAFAYRWDGKVNPGLKTAVETYEAISENLTKYKKYNSSWGGDGAEPMGENDIDLASCCVAVWTPEDSMKPTTVALEGIPTFAN